MEDAERERTMQPPIMRSALIGALAGIAEGGGEDSLSAFGSDDHRCRRVCVGADRGSSGRSGPRRALPSRMDSGD
jgi:hypothetical protein